MFEGRKGEGNPCNIQKLIETHTGGEGVRVVGQQGRASLFLCTALQKCVVFLIT